MPPSIAAGLRNGQYKLLISVILNASFKLLTLTMLPQVNELRPREGKLLAQEDAATTGEQISGPWVQFSLHSYSENTLSAPGHSWAASRYCSMQSWLSSIWGAWRGVLAVGRGGLSKC